MVSLAKMNVCSGAVIYIFQGFVAYANSFFLQGVYLSWLLRIQHSVDKLLHPFVV
jgi:hypothetical protein